jgi:hypothetical protein
VAETIADPYVLTTVRAIGSAILYDLREFSDAREMVGKVVEVAAAREYLSWLPIGIAHGGRHRVLGGDQEGVSQCHQGIEMLRQIGIRTSYVTNAARLAESLLDVGSLSEADALLDELLQTSDTGVEACAACELWRLKAQVASKSGDPRRAREFLEKAVDAATRSGATLFEVRALVDLCSLADGLEPGRTSLATRMDTIDADLPDAVAARDLLRRV